MVSVVTTSVVALLAIAGVWQIAHGDRRKGSACIAAAAAALAIGALFVWFR
jgi:hypothetical protein